MRDRTAIDSLFFFCLDSSSLQYKDTTVSEEKQKAFGTEVHEQRQISLSKT